MSCIEPGQGSVTMAKSASQAVTLLHVGQLCGAQAWPSRDACANQRQRFEGWLAHRLRGSGQSRDAPSKPDEMLANCAPAARATSQSAISCATPASCPARTMVRALTQSLGIPTPGLSPPAARPNRSQLAVRGEKQMVRKTASKRSSARVPFAVLGVALALSLQLPFRVLAQDGPLKLYSKKSSYDDVRFDLHNAIISRGLTIDLNGQLSKMLERTGADVGSTQPVYKQAEYFTFCSAKLSRAMMEADPSNVGFCPYVVFIYEPATAPGTTHVGYRRLQREGSAASKAALAQIEQLLDGIVKEALK